MTEICKGYEGILKTEDKASKEAGLIRGMESVLRSRELLVVLMQFKVRVTNRSLGCSCSRIELKYRVKYKVK